MQGGLWDNQVGTLAAPDGFDPGTGEVVFLTDIIIQGSNRWYDFTCTVPGTVIQFEAQEEQTIVNNGTLRIEGAAGNPSPAVPP